MPEAAVLEPTQRVRSLFTTVRDRETNRHDFVTSSDRLVSLILERALGFVEAEEVTVDTPCGPYSGCRQPPAESLCAVSIMRAADCMVGVARSLMPAISIGKILIQRDETTATPVLMYSKLPHDIGERAAVLLLDPMLATGGSAITAIKVLVEAGVSPKKVVFASVVACDEGIAAVAAAYPDVQVVTGAIDPILNEKKYIVPGLGDFGDRYFGTDGW